MLIVKQPKEQSLSVCLSVCLSHTHTHTYTHTHMHIHTHTYTHTHTRMRIHTHTHICTEEHKEWTKFYWSSGGIYKLRKNKQKLTYRDIQRSAKIFFTANQTQLNSNINIVMPYSSSRHFINTNSFLIVENQGKYAKQHINFATSILLFKSITRQKITFTENTNWDQLNQ